MLSVVSGLLLTVNSQLIDWWRWMQKAAWKTSVSALKRTLLLLVTRLKYKHPESWAQLSGCD